MTDLTHDYANRRARVTEPQYREAQAVMSRTRPLCIVELRKAPATYAWLADMTNNHREPDGVMWNISFHTGDEGKEIVVAENGFFQAYIDLLKRRALYGTRASFLVAMGTLCGYVQEDPTRESTRVSAAEWWFSIGGCGCSKCGGPITRREQLTLDAHTARTTDIYK